MKFAAREIANEFLMSAVYLGAHIQKVVSKPTNFTNQPKVTTDIIIMHTKTFIDNWNETTNNFDTTKYLNLYLTDAILDDLSVGRRAGIEVYFNSYFIAYNTYTEIIKSYNHTKIRYIGNRNCDF